MPRVILTGAPGAGKTTLLQELDRLGFATVSESAREVIAERLSKGESPRPDPRTFAQEVYRRDTKKYQATRSTEHFVFFDRSPIESLGSIHEHSPLSEGELRSQLGCYDFYRTVFLLPPWEEIYCTDTERDHSFEHALRVHQSLLSWYSSCGYQVQEVPRLPVPERAQALLHALRDA
jgi:predicted ATPase